MKYIEKLVMAHIKNSTPAKLYIHHYAFGQIHLSAAVMAVVMHTVFTSELSYLPIINTGTLQGSNYINELLLTHGCKHPHILICQAC